MTDKLVHKPNYATVKCVLITTISTNVLRFTQVLVYNTLVDTVGEYNGVYREAFYHHT